jgi:hypothetical protein
MAPILSDTATAIHSLTGRSPALDRLAEVVAADLIFVLLLPTVVLWLQRGRPSCQRGDRPGRGDGAGDRLVDRRVVVRAPAVRR